MKMKKYGSFDEYFADQSPNSALLWKRKRPSTPPPSDQRAFSALNEPGNGVTEQGESKSHKSCKAAVLTVVVF